MQSFRRTTPLPLNRVTPFYICTIFKPSTLSLEIKAMATPCNDPKLKKSPFTTYRNPDTGEWIVKKKSMVMSLVYAA
jgi:hypothetical protein